MIMMMIIITIINSKTKSLCSKVAAIFFFSGVQMQHHLKKEGEKRNGIGRAEKKPHVALRIKQGKPMWTKSFL